MSDEVQLKDLIKGVKFIKDTSLIKVRTIKSKYLDQIPTAYSNSAFTKKGVEVEMLGRVLATNQVLYRVDGEKIFQVHAMDLSSTLASLIIHNEKEAVNANTATVSAQKIIDDLPVIFED